MSDAVANFHSTRYISGFTHGLYRYPATTSPELVREILLRFSEVDDYVLDPFLGGGTTIVEALAHGRRALGSDLNPLAVFIARVKTTPLMSADWSAIGEWLSRRPLEQLGPTTKTDRRAANLPHELNQSLSAALALLGTLNSSRQRAFARGALLRTAQWALESRQDLPAPSELQVKLDQVVKSLHIGMDAFVETARNHGVSKTQIRLRRRIALCPAEGLSNQRGFQDAAGKVRLVITSPPYPGVHVLYHRWQVSGRRETAAPYWIARRRDGFGPSYYTMGGRSEIGQARYFERLAGVFAAIKPLLASEARVVQLVAFSKSDEQLPRFLSAMEVAGYASLWASDGDQLVRRVPHRRWYVNGKDSDGSKEYLLLHSPIR